MQRGLLQQQNSDEFVGIDLNQETDGEVQDKERERRLRRPIQFVDLGDLTVEDYKTFTTKEQQQSVLNDLSHGKQFIDFYRSKLSYQAIPSRSTIFNGFKQYSDGFQLGNKAYGSSVMESSVVPFAVAILAVVITLLLLGFRACRKKPILPRQPVATTKHATPLRVVTAVLTVAATILSLVIIYSSLQVAQQSRDVYDVIYDRVGHGREVATKMMHHMKATNESIRPDTQKLTPEQSSIVNLTRGVQQVYDASLSADDTLYESRAAAHGVTYTGLILAVLNACAIVAVVGGATIGVMSGSRSMLAIFAAAQLVLCVLCFVSCGIVLMLRSGSTDMCSELNNYLMEPKNSTLYDRLPCQSALGKQEFLIGLKTMVNEQVALVNDEVIGTLAADIDILLQNKDTLNERLNWILDAEPVPLICEPFDSTKDSLPPAACPFPSKRHSARLTKLDEVYGKYTCRGAENLGERGALIDALTGVLNGDKTRDEMLKDVDDRVRRSDQFNCIVGGRLLSSKELDEIVETSRIAVSAKQVVAASTVFFSCHTEHSAALLVLEHHCKPMKQSLYYTALAYGITAAVCFLLAVITYVSMGIVRSRPVEAVTVATSEGDGIFCCSQSPSTDSPRLGGFGGAPAPAKRATAPAARQGAIAQQDKMVNSREAMMHAAQGIKVARAVEKAGGGGVTARSVSAGAGASARDATGGQAAEVVEEAGQGQEKKKRGMRVVLFGNGGAVSSDSDEGDEDGTHRGTMRSGGRVVKGARGRGRGPGPRGGHGAGGGRMPGSVRSRYGSEQQLGTQRSAGAWSMPPLPPHAMHAPPPPAPPPPGPYGPQQPPYQGHPPPPYHHYY